MGSLSGNCRLPLGPAYLARRCASASSRLSTPSAPRARHTLEAFTDYLAHLSPRGALWFSRPEVQLPRMVATAREALALRGIVDAERRMVVFAAGGHPSFYGGLVVSLLGPTPSTFLVRELSAFLRLLASHASPVPFVPLRPFPAVQV